MKFQTIVSTLALSVCLLLVVLGPMIPLRLVKPDLAVIELERMGCYGICPHLLLADPGKRPRAVRGAAL